MLRPKFVTVGWVGGGTGQKERERDITESEWSEEENLSIEVIKRAGGWMIQMLWG